MHELLRRRFIFAAAVGSALLRHGAADSRAVRVRFDVAAGIDVAVAHEFTRASLFRTTRERGESCKDAALLRFRPGPWDAFSRRKHAVFRHLGPGYFLDLTGGAGSVVDPGALSEPQAADVLLA
jgi:hypothetical protein